MVAQSKITSIEKAQDPNALREESSWVLALVKNKNKIVAIGVALLALGLCLGWLSHLTSRARAKKTSLAYASLDDLSGLQTHSNLKQVKSIAAKYPFLQAHLDAPLAQEYLNQQDLRNAQQLHQRVQSRLSPYLKEVFLFNEISFLIAQNKYEDALALSENLTQLLSKQDMPVLTEYHSLREALLKNKIHHEGYHPSKESFSSDLTLGQLSLKDFLLKTYF